MASLVSKKGRGGMNPHPSGLRQAGVLVDHLSVVGRRLVATSMPSLVSVDALDLLDKYPGKKKADLEIMGRFAALVELEQG